MSRGKVLYKLLSVFVICCFSVLLALLNFAQSDTDSDSNEIYVWSHNDYEQPEPLKKALNYGYQMIEADIHLIDGLLYVSHDYPDNLNRTPTLEQLYLEPLFELVDKNQGIVLPKSKLPFYLVIDVKSEAYTTYDMLLEVLEPYHEYFERKENGEWIQGPIRLLISGNRPYLDSDDENRIAFIDGRVPDIGMGYSSDYYPIISDNWFNYFSWDGDGEIPNSELTKLQEIVESVHAEEKRIRFWATPDNVNIWDVLIEENVDIINVDSLSKFRNYLNSIECNLHLLE